MSMCTKQPSASLSPRRLEKEHGDSVPENDWYPPCPATERAPGAAEVPTKPGDGHDPGTLTSTLPQPEQCALSWEQGGTPRLLGWEEWAFSSYLPISAVCKPRS